LAGTKEFGLEIFYWANYSFYWPINLF